jgi:hypothetical protein
MLDEIIDYIMEIPDMLMDAPSMIGEFFSSAFENIGEFSVTGLVFGILGTGLIFILRKNLIDSFTSHMSVVGGFTIMILTYIVVFIGCYFIGNYFENS